jgi:tetratricopeptide (TPR) repeat protein
MKLSFLVGGSVSLFPSRRAEALHAAGMKSSDAGDDVGAIEHYRQALALDPRRSNTLYNLGLIYKYRRAWGESFDYNQRAAQLQPDDEATQWNLAIAATALCDWRTARDVWHRLNIVTEPGRERVRSRERIRKMKSMRSRNYATTPAVRAKTGPHRFALFAGPAAKVGPMRGTTKTLR